jgi:hypothetical protein
VAQVFSKIPDCGNGELNAELCCVWVCDWDWQDGFAAAVQRAGALRYRTAKDRVIGLRAAALGGIVV